MIWVRGEGEDIHQGLNIYPWFERHFSIGFVFRIYKWTWRVRYAPQVKKLYWGRW